MTYQKARSTKETDINIQLQFNDEASQINTGVGFLDHMPVSYTHLRAHETDS